MTFAEEHELVPKIPELLRSKTLLEERVTSLEKELSILSARVQSLETINRAKVQALRTGSAEPT